MIRRVVGKEAILLCVVAGAAACGGMNGVTRPATTAPSPESARGAGLAGTACGRTLPAARTAQPRQPPRTGSTVALATQGGKTLAFAADEDDWAIHVVDVDERREVGQAPLEGRPSQLMFLSDGRLVVLLRDASKVQVMEPGTAPGQLQTRCAVPTAPEPVGLALSPDDATLYVTSGWGRAFAAFDAQTLEKRFELPLPREPRAIVVSDDGRTAYVSHAVGARASKIELGSRTVSDIRLLTEDPNRPSGRAKQASDDVAPEAAGDRDAGATGAPPGDGESEGDNDEGIGGEGPRSEQGSTGFSCQGFALAKSTAPAGRIFAPQVLVDTGDPSERAAGYGSDETATEQPDVAVIDAITGAPMAASLERSPDAAAIGADAVGRDGSRGECLLPRAATFEPGRASLLVACVGIDAVIEYDALAASPTRVERRRWSVAGGPNGIALDGAKDRAVVWSQFERALSVIDLGGDELADDRAGAARGPTRVDLPPSRDRALSTEAALGRQLFHAVGDGRISQDGRACASCHPDGRDDALVWATPEGPRRSIMLAGRLQATAPYAWSGTHEDLKIHLSSTFERLSGSGGLKGVELDALVAYIRSLPPPPRAAAASTAASTATASADARVERGRQLFTSPEVGCSGCHAGAAGTDGERHDVGSKTPSDRSGMFNTPSLRFVGGTGPYFHDGRYQTLGDLLTKNRDTMGHTQKLHADDLEALEAYLRTR